MSNRMNRIFWLVGQSGTGKTVLGERLHKFLTTEKRNWRRDVFHLDEKYIRELCNNTDYTKKGDNLNTTTIQLMASMLYDAGCDVVVSSISPTLRLRESFKESNPNVVEILLHTDSPRETERSFNPEFELPEMNFIDINTTKHKPDKAFSKIINLLTKSDKL
jgi:adenylylsulfate kinase-like enzyme